MPTTFKCNAKNAPSAGSDGGTPSVTVTCWSKRMEITQRRESINQMDIRAEGQKPSFSVVQDRSLSVSGQPHSDNLQQ